MDSQFLNLVRGTRLSAHLGLQMLPDVAYKFAPSYLYVEIPVDSFWNPGEEKVQGKGLRNQHLLVQPACTIDVRGSCLVEVEPNRALSEYGTISGGIYRVHPGSGRITPGFYVTLRRDMELADVDWAVRLYLLP